MYGLVNRAIEGLVRSQHGDDTWDQIRQRAGVEEEVFVSMESYPDSITYGLVGAASELLEVPAEDLLKAFGRYWVQYVADEGYGAFFNMAGNTFDEVLENLDAMHARVMATMSDLRPPSFRLERNPDGSRVLRYESERQGLAPMVVGLLEGLSERMNEPIEIAPGETIDGVTTFHLQRRAAAA